MNRSARILYIIDDVNFKGGAHVATFSLLPRLVEYGAKVEVLTLAETNEEARVRLRNIPINVAIPPRKTLGHFIRALLRRFGIYWYPNWTLGLSGKWYRYAASFDTVCCLGEPSMMRWFTASLPKRVHKVVMIHTDYAHWCRLDKDSKRASRFDRWWYAKCNKIAVVGVPNAERMKKLLPSIADLIVPFHNIIKTIKRPDIVRCDSEKVKIVTLSRLNWGPQKKTDALLRVAARLKAAGVKFDWTIYGDGPTDHVERLMRLANELHVLDAVKMPGFSVDAQSELAKADLSVMLSDYEGLSNGIYESMMLGVPVFSTRVGGAEEQINDGVNGWLVENDDEKIFEKLKAVLSNRRLMGAVRETLRDYHYDNDKALQEHLVILGIEG